jgi:hypothetical protein
MAATGEKMATVADRIDDAGDAMGRWKNVQLLIGTMFADAGAKILGGSKGINGFFDSLETRILGSDEKFQEMATSIRDFFVSVSGKSLSENLNNFSSMIGESFGRGMLRGMNPLRPAMDSAYNAGANYATELDVMGRDPMGYLKMTAEQLRPFAAHQLDGNRILRDILKVLKIPTPEALTTFEGPR